MFKPEQTFAMFMEKKNLSHEETRFAFEWFLVGWGAGLERAMQVQNEIAQPNKQPKELPHARKWTVERHAKMQLYWKKRREKKQSKQTKKEVRKNG